LLSKSVTNIYTPYVTPWNRVLEKPSVAQLLKHFPKCYETRGFITVSIRALHWSLP
jgi:hypothetical protein